MVMEASFVSRTVASRDTGGRYLAAQQRSDGAIGEPERAGLGPYYKSLWALTAVGMPAEANHLGNWIVANVLTPEGDFAGPMRGTEHNNNYAYPNAWMICGAQKLGRHDIAYPGLRFLLALHDPETGGFRMQRDKMDAAQDVLNASQAGNACLNAGRIDVALRVGAFLQMMWDAQPHPERELFFVYEPGIGLRTEFPAERQRQHSIRTDTPRQAYYQMGIAAAFLARLTMATGDARWVDLGKQYLDIGYDVLDEMYETAQVGKVGWGAALVYGVAGEERHLRLAVRAGEAMMAQQTDTGGWDNTGGYVNDAIRAEITAEFIVLLDEMAGGLSMRAVLTPRP